MSSKYSEYLNLYLQIWKSTCTWLKYLAPTLVQIMAWRRPGDKPLSEPMMIGLPTHICVTRPQWVNCSVAVLPWPLWQPKYFPCTYINHGKFDLNVFPGKLQCCDHGGGGRDGGGDGTGPKTKSPPVTQGDLMMTSHLDHLLQRNLNENIILIQANVRIWHSHVQYVGHFIHESM